MQTSGRRSRPRSGGGRQESTALRLVDAETTLGYMRLPGISSQEAANAWLARFIRAFNRRFAVHPAALRHILSIHMKRRLSSKLSCQLDGLLYQARRQYAPDSRTPRST